jgi:hypothetical protein
MIDDDIIVCKNSSEEAMHQLDGWQSAAGKVNYDAIR